jgi:hypothetical protein
LFIEFVVFKSIKPFNVFNESLAGNYFCHSVNLSKNSLTV